MSLDCVLLIVASAVLEIVGLGLVAVDLWHIQRRELGTPRWVRGAGCSDVARSSRFTVPTWP